MARYTGPRLRISRRLRTPIFGPSKYLERKDYPPGQHGQSRRRKATDYALALMEKQKLRFYYGLMEKQFRGVYEKANRRRGVTGEIMLQILETRLDNIVYSLGFGYSRAQARQMERPMPEEPPVTTTVLPSSSSFAAPGGPGFRRRRPIAPR